MNKVTITWSLSLANLLVDAPWPLTKDELIDYVNHTTGNAALLDNLYALEGDDEEYDSIYDLWEDYPCAGDMWAGHIFDNEGVMFSDEY